MRNLYLERAVEKEYRKYLAEKSRKKFFWNDYFALGAIGSVIGLIWLGYRLKISLDAMTAVFLLYSAVVIGSYNCLKKHERRKMAQAVSREQAWEKWQNELQKKDKDALREDIAELLQKMGWHKDGEKLYWQNEGYVLKLANENDWQNFFISNEEEDVLLVFEKMCRREERIICQNAQAKVILASYRDLFDLALERKVVQISAPKLKSEERVPRIKRAYLLWYGLLLLFLAEWSRYFYLYFAAGIFLLSLYLVNGAKKTQAKQTVLLKKMMKSAKIKA